MRKKIAIIPARSGSKGLPNKNILMLFDKPLIAYTIEAAIKSELFEKVIVSTDSCEYKDIALRHGAEVIMRDKSLASDTATSYMVVKDVLEKNISCDYFVLLQPTSPFRNYKHIREAVEKFENTDDIDFLVSMVKTNKSADLINQLAPNDNLKYFNADFANYRRQNQENYCPNGAIFIGNVDAYLRQKHFFGERSIAYVMDRIDSLDIDDKLDFEFAISLMLKKNRMKDLQKEILKRIKEKEFFFDKIKPVTLVGHSIIDYWNVTHLNGREVNNLGIAGINSKEYYDLIIKNNIIKFGDTVILMLGTNDIVVDDWSVDFTILWIEKIVKHIKKINHNASIYILSIPPVLGRIDRNNETIRKLNSELSKFFEN
ncbi:acylneuraminate cytidylyltransferase, partial [Escherichia coli]|nr:acylneuraminate cytidylyltransferase [Escherichia coli]